LALILALASSPSGAGHDVLAFSGHESSTRVLVCHKEHVSHDWFGALLAGIFVIAPMSPTAEVVLILLHRIQWLLIAVSIVVAAATILVIVTIAVVGVVVVLLFPALIAVSSLLLVLLLQLISEVGRVEDWWSIVCHVGEMT